MANEITITSSLQVNNNGLQAGVPNGNVSVNQATPGSIQAVQSISHSAPVVVSTTGLTTPKALHIQNLDPVNFVEIGPDHSGTFVPFIHLGPGMFETIALVAGVVIKAKADTADLLISKFGVES